MISAIGLRSLQMLSLILHISSSIHPIFHLLVVLPGGMVRYSLVEIALATLGDESCRGRFHES